MSLKSLARDLAPPFIWRGASAAKRALSKPPPPAPVYGHSGDYRTFDEALAASTGYDCDEAVAYAMRETMAIDQQRCSHAAMRLLAAIEYAYIRSGALRVLDFGGGLGGHYLIAKAHVPVESWTVCELPRMAKIGRKHWAGDKTISFTDRIQDQRPTIVLASGSLQYCRDPYSVLALLIALKANFVILDRLPIMTRQRLTVQLVPPHLFGGSFPAWFLEEEKVCATLHGYALTLQWRLPEHVAQIDGQLHDVYRGMLLSCTTHLR